MPGSPPYEPSREAAVTGQAQDVSGYVDRCARRILVRAGKASCRDQSSIRFQFIQQVGRAELNQGVIVSLEGPMLQEGVDALAGTDEGGSFFSNGVHL